MSINILMPALSPTMTEGKLAKWHVKVGDAVKSGQVDLRDRDRQGHDGSRGCGRGQDRPDPGRGRRRRCEGQRRHRRPAGRRREGRRQACDTCRGRSRRPRPKRSLPKSQLAPAAAPAPAARPAKPAASAWRHPHLRLAAGQAHSGGQGHRPRRPQGLRAERPHRQGRRREREARRRSGCGGSQGCAKALLPRRRPPAANRCSSSPGDSRVPHTSIRKVIARRMLESKQTVPHFYLTVDFEIDALLDGAHRRSTPSSRRRAPRSRSTTW